MRNSNGEASIVALAAGVALATLVAGSTQCMADSPAKIDTASFNAPPAYPSSAQASGEQGDVVLDVEVNDAGRARDVRVKRSSGFDDLDNAAIETALNWRYIPAVVNGDTATSWTTIKIHYEKPVAPPNPEPKKKPKN